MLDTSRFQDAAKYAAYLKTTAGRLRAELAWENLRHFLPCHVSTQCALDVGGGTGFASVQLARLGFAVVLLDGSEEMLDAARTQTETDGVAERASFHHADASRMPELFEAGAFDVVVCHNLLEYLEDPSRTVCDIAHVLRKDGVLSVLLRNRAGEVLRAAIKSGDRALATANLSAETVVDPLFGEPVRLFAPAEVCDMLGRAGLEVVAEHGVRVFSDYIGAEEMAGEFFRSVFELELNLGARPEFAAIARYLQVIARRSAAPSSKRTEQ